MFTDHTGNYREGINRIRWRGRYLYIWISRSNMQAILSVGLTAVGGWVGFLLKTVGKFIIATGDRGYQRIW